MQKKSKIENFIFTVIMAFVMDYAMVCYNIAIDKGGMATKYLPWPLRKFRSCGQLR